MYCSVASIGHADIMWSIVSSRFGNVCICYVSVFIIIIIIV